MNDAPAILVLGPGGLAVARRIAEAVPEATIYGYRARLPDISNGFQSVAGEVQTLFRAGRPVIGICAAGILIRAVASLLTDKTEEPPVIAVAEDGSAVVPLLGGHQGGNDLAREIAAVLEIAPSITTAGDLRLGLALDDPPPGWAIADPARAKPVMAALLAGEPVGLAGDEELPDWLRGIPLERRTGLSPSLTLTTHAGEGNDGAVLVPKRLVLGIGAERFAETEALERLVEVVLAEAECRPEAVAAITTLDLKAAEPAIIEVASRLGVPVRLF